MISEQTTIRRQSSGKTAENILAVPKKTEVRRLKEHGSAQNGSCYLRITGQQVHDRRMRSGVSRTKEVGVALKIRKLARQRRYESEKRTKRR